MITLFAATGVLLTSTPALAAPAAEPTTAVEAAQLMVNKGQELEILTEQFNDARVALETDQAEAAQATAAAQAAQAAFEAARVGVTDVARSAYTGGNQLTSLQALLTSGSADEFVDQVSTLDLLSTHTTEVLTAAQAANDAATASQQQAEQATTAAQGQLDAVTAQQDALNTQIADYQAQYDALTAAERASVAATGSAGGSDGTSAAASSGSVAPSSVVASSEAAQVAVDTALAQLGDPYVWAASGPDSFDCSGLVQYAYAAAGISLPHSSASQASMGQSVSRSELQPGDLVAFYSPVSHIGIYIGDGQMVHAPTSGDVVKVASIDAMGSSPTAYRRIAG